MPSRILREGINDSRAVNALTDDGEILYRRLMSIVDDYGRYEADVDLLRGQLFARSLDRWSPSRVSQALANVSKMLTDDGQLLVRVYTIAGRTTKYLQINNFKQRVRTPSKYPDPPAGPIDSNPPSFDGHLRANARLGGGGCVVECGGVVGDGFEGEGGAGESAEVQQHPDPEPPTARPLPDPEPIPDEPRPEPSEETIRRDRQELWPDPEPPATPMPRQQRNSAPWLEPIRQALAEATRKPSDASDPLPAELAYRGALLGAHPTDVARWVFRSKGIESHGFFTTHFDEKFPIWLRGHPAAIPVRERGPCQCREGEVVVFADCVVSHPCESKGMARIGTETALAAIGKAVAMARGHSETKTPQNVPEGQIRETLRQVVLHGQRPRTERG